MNNKIIQIIITTVLILIIILLIYLIIIYLLKPYEEIKTLKESGNYLDLNKHIIKKSLDSKNLNSDYIQKYLIKNNYMNFENYNVIFNKDDSRNFFQANDNKFYLNIK